MKCFRRQVLLISAALLAGAAICAAAVLGAKGAEGEPVLYSGAVETAAAVGPARGDSSGPETTLEISAVGDCTLGNDYRQNSLLHPTFTFYRNILRKPDGYFFSKVKGFFEHDDLSLANCEVVLTQGGKPIPKGKQEGGEWWMKGSPANAGILKAGGIEAVNQANNHSMDFGSAGLANTKKALKKAGVTCFGNGDVPILTRKGVKIALLGYNLLGPLEEGIDPQQMKQEIVRDMQTAKKNADLIVVMFHWGVEKTFRPNDMQVDFGHYAIDCGADLVLGSHSHTIQPIEFYEGKPIVYSLGNFCYGGSVHVSDPRTFIFKMLYTMDGNRKVVRSRYEVIPCVFSKGGTNNYQPAAVTSEQQALEIKEVLFGAA